jgi:hypothetical protein
LPEAIAIQVDCENTLFPEEGIDSLAIGGGGTAGIAVFGQIALERVLCILGSHCVPPEFASCRAVDSNQVPH